MEPFLIPGGGYRKLLVYKLSVIIFDLTEYFIRQFLGKGNRTVDQMRQAARSGKQNIVEGSMASTTSKETEIKLTNVAKASFGELLEDYIDYLRVNGREHWSREYHRQIRLKKYVKTDEFMTGYADLFPRLKDYELANLAITLIHQVIYLLSKMLEAQQQQFLKNGGIREQMSRARRATFRSDGSPRRDD